MRKFALAASACMVLSATFAYAQQLDFAVSGSTLWSPAANNSSEAFQPPAEKHGVYIGLNGDYVGFKYPRFGFNVESSWRYKQGNYPFNGETYRPIFTDFNALYQPHISKKLGADLMAGIGIADTRFYIPSNSFCSVPQGGCINYTSSDHFMEHLSGGIRYYFFRRYFIRPEIHYYHIQDNVGFHSDNVFRGGASVGYTFGSR
ncbi:MAG: hypothetical protein WAN65_26475 [Candidatus Sulfotelmatobacter sp.]